MAQMTFNTCQICGATLEEYQDVCRKCKENARLKRKEIEEML